MKQVRICYKYMAKKKSFHIIKGFFVYESSLYFCWAPEDTANEKISGKQLHELKDKKRMFEVLGYQLSVNGPELKKELETASAALYLKQ